ncbi:MAG: 2-iminoacetate synthase ThiH, partial [Deltaproteobacteria bacterium]|nr:2-iminoacetate synthase ThiH [Deltaproteobacteria bacterium]
KANDATVQFEVTDTRSVEEITQMIRQNGYQPVFKDWEIF